MTAPLIQTHTLNKTSLRTSVYQLLDAIEINHMIKVELLLCEILKENLPEVSLQLFYNYAQRKGCKEVCAYLKTVLLTMHNS